LKIDRKKTLFFTNKNEIRKTSRCRVGKFLYNIYKADKVLRFFKTYLSLNFKLGKLRKNKILIFNLETIINTESCHTIWSKPIAQLLLYYAVQCLYYKNPTFLLSSPDTSMLYAYCKLLPISVACQYLPSV